MFDKLDELERKYESLNGQMVDPETLADQQKYSRIAKQHRDLQEVVTKYREYKQISQGIQDTRELLAAESDAEMLEMAKAELGELEGRHSRAEEELKILLIPKDPSDEKNVILEIRAEVKCLRQNVAVS